MDINAKNNYHTIKLYKFIHYIFIFDYFVVVMFSFKIGQSTKYKINTRCRNRALY